jgi:hypothetical protein
MEHLLQALYGVDASEWFLNMPEKNTILNGVAAIIIASFSNVTVNNESICSVSWRQIAVDFAYCMVFVHRLHPHQPCITIAITVVEDVRRDRQKIRHALK